MPFMLILVGLVLVITAFQDTYKQLGAQLRADFTGPNSFLVWIVALVIVGAIGYIPGWERFSRWFMALILLAIVLANYKRGNIAQQFMQGIRNPVRASAATNAPPAVAATGASGSAPSWSSAIPSIVPGIGPAARIFEWFR